MIFLILLIDLLLFRTDGFSDLAYSFVIVPGGWFFEPA